MGRALARRGVRNHDGRTAYGCISRSSAPNAGQVARARGRVQKVVQTTERDLLGHLWVGSDPKGGAYESYPRRARGGPAGVWERDPGVAHLRSDWLLPH